ncbi:Mss4-like protein [Hymenopellis radicata]|nr:Mss4-like protein [Hymenopellis radicata]
MSTRRVQKCYTTRTRRHLQSGAKCPGKYCIYYNSTAVQLHVRWNQRTPKSLAAPCYAATSESTSWWLIEPSPMEFENIGFSRAVEALPLSPEGTTRKKLKLLICAECDLGPFGWCEEGGQKFWLACSRVGYKYVE